MPSPVVMAARVLGKAMPGLLVYKALGAAVPSATSPAGSSQGLAADQVKSVCVLDQTLEVSWNDAQSYAFPLVWLRDNCNRPRCLHPDTQERTFDLLSVPEKLRVASAGLTGQGSVIVLWGDDGHASKYETGWLRSYALECTIEDAARPETVLWDGTLSNVVPRFDYGEVMDSEAGLSAWLTALLSHGVAVVSDTPHRDREVIRVAERIAYARRSNFGEHFEVRAESNPINNAYTALKLQNHTDLCNWERPPGYQFLHCLENGALGGETTLVDGFCAADALRRSDADAFHLLSATPVLFRYHDAECDLRFRDPVIRQDDTGRLEQIRFNFGLFGVQALPANQMAAFYSAYRKYAQLARDDRYQIRFKLESGDLLTFDNWRVLHGRQAYQPSTGNRHLQGCYVDRDEVLSRLRVSTLAASSAAELVIR